VFRSHSESNKARLHSNPPKGVKILLKFEDLFKSKPSDLATTLKELKEMKIIKTKQGSPKDNQAKHKNKES